LRYRVFSISGAKNTIHVDDLVSSILFARDTGLIGLFQGRNFALNPRQGLKISAFRDAHTPRAMADRELDDLAKYLLHAATITDMETLNHKVNVKPH
jgi:ubiquitin-like domain-containing CTD phosphatase 1